MFCLLFSLNYLLLKVSCHNKMPLTLCRREKKFARAISGLRGYAVFSQALCCGFCRIYVTLVLLLTYYFSLHLFFKNILNSKGIVIRTLMKTQYYLS